MKKSIMSAVVALTILSPIQVQAEEFTGTKFVEYCAKPADKTDNAFCSGFVFGVFYSWPDVDPDAETDSTKPEKEATICLPDDSSFTQMINVTVKYIEDNPAKEHQRIDDLMWNALSEAFPCEDDDDEF